MSNLETNLEMVLACAEDGGWIYCKRDVEFEVAKQEKKRKTSE